ncbi:hypothetical protein [Algibacillus agarilyticus]|uniref:hypothetical protein n=1 Tax=Algibacillus agarilyticus TaxID=2234133 RepID=UPI000DCFBF98|nr:hypothetical protein [Algibacillus agarilyticus]
MDHLLKSAIVNLHKDNKMVSVATIKSKVGTRIPLPFITREISTYKVDPEAYVTQYQNMATPPQVKEKVEPPQPLEKRVEILEAQVKTLHEQFQSLMNK